MKRVFRNSFIATIYCLCVFSLSAREIVSYQMFYDNLSPHGTWIDYPKYGHVWHPNVDVGFKPYATNGYWEYTNDGWYWNSQYDWGWAPFHYGRWFYDDAYGWLWIPGQEWAPAWVTWGYTDNFYAWAPLGPEISIDINFVSWRPHDFYWNIVERKHICDRDLSNRFLHNNRMKREASHITIINNFDKRENHFFAKGPEVHEVERATKQKITSVSLKEGDRNSHNVREGNSLSVYKPNIQRTEPDKFRKAEAKDIKPVMHNNSEWPKNDNKVQRSNIERMQVYHGAPTRAGSIHMEPTHMSQPHMQAPHMSSPHMEAPHGRGRR